MGTNRGSHFLSISRASIFNLFGNARGQPAQRDMEPHERIEPIAAVTEHPEVTSDRSPVLPRYYNIKSAEASDDTSSEHQPSQGVSCGDLAGKIIAADYNASNYSDSSSPPSNETRERPINVQKHDIYKISDKLLVDFYTEQKKSLVRGIDIIIVKKEFLKAKVLLDEPSGQVKLVFNDKHARAIPISDLLFEQKTLDADVLAEMGHDSRTPLPNLGSCGVLTDITRQKFRISTLFASPCERRGVGLVLFVEQALSISSDKHHANKATTTP